MADRADSLFWGWHWWNPLGPVTQTCPLIISFPVDVRTLIWINLNGRDQKSLKQVCKLFEFDLNQIVGVDAVLHGSKASKPLSLLSKAQWLLFGDPEIKRLQDNVNWIQSVLVRSLVIRQFPGVNCDTSVLVTKPSLLRSLSIEFDQRQQLDSLEGFNAMLQQYKQLKRIGLTFSTFDFQTRDYPAYNTVVVKIAENVFNNLEFKPNLSELSLRIKYSESKLTYPASEFIAMVHRRIGTLPEDPPILDLWLQNPVQLKKIDIEMPSLPIAHLRRWKKFIEGQNHLTHLKVNFGHVHWNFFSSVLERCARSLEVIDLVFINWYADNTEPDEVIFNPIPTDQWFNWNLIAQPNSKLKSITISTHCSYLRLLTHKQIDTLNFDQLTLLCNLEELSLFGIYLTQTQLEIIFKDLRGLRKIMLVCWTRVLEAVVQPENEDDVDNLVLPNYDYTERNQNLCTLLNQVLPLNRLDSINLTDASIYFCTEELRQTILDQPLGSLYTVIWPSNVVLQHLTAAFTRCFDCPMSISKINQ